MKIQHDAPLSEVLWYRIGGTARYLLEVGNQGDLCRAIEFIERERPDRVFVIGLGSNLVFPDGYYDGVIVRVVRSEGPSTCRLDDERIRSYGGVVLDAVIRAAFERRLTGLEWAGGLPGTLGAGVRGNVGAFGGEIKDSLESADVVALSGAGCEVTTLTAQDLAFSYRDSRVKRERGSVVLSATFRLHPADDVELTAAKAVYDNNIAYRQRRHPMEYPNCGSVFKNIHTREQVERVLSRWPDVEQQVRADWHGKVSMGYIINRLGFAGRQVGGARVSEKHNNFIVNTGGARSEDVRTTISQIQSAVEQTFGFVPEVEIEIVDG